MMKASFPLILLLLALGGCVRLDDHGFDNAKLAADLKTMPAISISTYTPFAWDRFYVFGPRNSRNSIKDELGAKVPFPHKESETHCLLVFTSGGAIAAAFEEPRSLVDFINLYVKGGYSRAQSVFKGAVAANGALVLRKG